MPSRTLVACLGNIFLSDDGFGVAVAERLAREDLGERVQVVDYGIRGMHLAYDIGRGWDTTILVDATRRGEAPGTVYVVEPERGGAPAAAGAPPAGLLFDPHGMRPDVVLGMAGMLGEQAGQVLVVGCEPASLEEGIGLTPAVAAAVEEAARVVRRLAACGGAPPGPGAAGRPQAAER